MWYIFIQRSHQSLQSKLTAWQSKRSVDELAMNIVSISASLIPANTANSIQVLKATQALAGLGHRVTLLVPGATATPWADLQAHYGLQHALEIIWIPENLAFKRYDFAIKAVQRARQLGADLIYTWMLQAGVLALWRGLPTILELHDRVTGRVGPWLFRQFCASKTCQRVLTNTDALKHMLMADFHLEPTAVDILTAPNGVDLERYQGLPAPVTARQALGLPDRFTAGYTGHFYAGRGMDLMFELAKALPEIHFLWVGGEDDAVAYWKDRLTSAGLRNLTLTGFVPNEALPHYQAAADLLLMPYGRQIAGSGGVDSAKIASPMKMFEYMAAGRAIISSDLPVIHEVLNAEMAVFCPPDDLPAWIDALSTLRAQPSACQALGEAARSAVEGYTWTARAERVLSGLI
jgi:glycosyltransferase involved in cell wall biosynthesis